jgi:hypothetical protein
LQGGSGETLEIVGRVIKKHPVGNIAANRDEFRQIFEDMRHSGGAFTPTPTWLLCRRPEEIESVELSEIIELAGSDEVFQKEFSDLEQRMHGWIGGGNAKNINEPSVAEQVAKYASFLARRDPLGLWKANVGDQTVSESLRVADLGSLMDLTLIYTYGFKAEKKRTTILEIGGGYGRLAEAALNVFGDSVRYVLLDSVPVSLYYAKKYLEQACPQMRIGSYYSGDPFDMEAFNCYIIPAWYFEELNRETYDICINIESFQEMNQQHIDTYLELFDRVSVSDAIVYLDNARDYIFRGNWNHPTHWQKLFLSNTPRSWTPDHPAEVFLKSRGDFSSQNALLEDLHYFMLNKETPGPTLGDQIEQLAGKRVRGALSRGRTVLARTLSAGARKAQ